MQLQDPQRRPQEPHNTLEPQQREQQPPDPLQLPAAQLLTALRTSREGAAPGPSGLTADTVRIVFDDRTTTARFVAVCQQFDSPELAGEQRQRFATAVGVLLDMSADGPDAQHCIRVLASQLTCRTRADYQTLNAWYFIT